MRPRLKDHINAMNEERKQQAQDELALSHYGEGYDFLDEQQQDDVDRVMAERLIN